MSKGVNKAILVGRLGSDPDVKQLQSGPIANISLATSYSTKDKQTGEWQDETEWHRVVFFGRLAEVVQQYLHKGSQIYVEGSLRTEKWQDKNGIDRYTTKIIAREMLMLEGGSGKQGQPQPQQPQPQQPQGQPQPQQGQYGNNLSQDVPF